MPRRALKAGTLLRTPSWRSSPRSGGPTLGEAITCPRGIIGLLPSTLPAGAYIREERLVEDGGEWRSFVGRWYRGVSGLPTPLASGVAGSGCPPCHPAYTTHHQTQLIPCCRHSAQPTPWPLRAALPRRRPWQRSLRNPLPVRRRGQGHER